MRNGLIIDNIGNHHWYLNDVLHRTDGPAIETANGCKAWFFNGLPHRANGPAVEYNTGGRQWYFNDARHRRDGPAIEHADGSKFWYYNDIEETQESNCTRERLRIYHAMINIQTWLPIASSGSIKFPLVNLIIQYL
jgi:hypothetical protein